MVWSHQPPRHRQKLESGAEWALRLPGPQLGLGDLRSKSEVAPLTARARLQCQRRTVQTLLVAPPPLAGFPAGFCVREMILVQDGANKAWRLLGKRISLQQREDFGRALQQADEKIHKPLVALHVAQR